MKSIPVHKLKERVDIGFEIKHSDNYEFRQKGHDLGAHRDDYYIFLIMESGSASLLIDFTEITLPEGSIYYILPGQVHHGVKVDRAKGWFMALDTLLLPKEVRTILEERLLLQQPYQPKEQQLQQCKNLLRLLCNQYNLHTGSAFYQQQIAALLNAFLYMAADGFRLPDCTQGNRLRILQLTQQFRRLLTANFATIKQPLMYADMLNITEKYLNEALKKATGFSVTYWIVNEVMLEAKRLLYYSELNVKEIAHQLGYEDHTYFSRLFKKHTAITPLQFRQTYRK